MHALAKLRAYRVVIQQLLRAENVEIPCAVNVPCILLEVFAAEPARS